jgi:hypothetical protein
MQEWNRSRSRPFQDCYYSNGIDMERFASVKPKELNKKTLTD